MAVATRRSRVDLVDNIDWSNVECLNQSLTRPVLNAIEKDYRDDDARYLESLADGQLVIRIPFTQAIKLHSIAITGPAGEGPKTVKLYPNKEHMGFSNVNDYRPSDTAVLSPNYLRVEGEPVVLNYVKFQNVHSLTIFIEDNQSGSNVTKVQKIALFGTAVETIDMKSLKKIEDLFGRHGYECRVSNTTTPKN